MLSVSMKGVHCIEFDQKDYVFITWEVVERVIFSKWKEIEQNKYLINDDNEKEIVHKSSCARLRIVILIKNVIFIGIKRF